MFSISLASLADAAIAQKQKEELEFRYKPRPGPIAAPEPEFSEFIDLIKAFEVDADTTELSMIRVQITNIVEQVYYHIDHAFHAITHDMQDHAILENKEIGIIDFQHLSKQCLKLFEEALFNKKDKIIEAVIELVDEKVHAVTRYLHVTKDKMLKMVFKARDACERHRIVYDRAIKHQLSESIRIAINRHEDNFVTEIKELKKTLADSEYSNGILTKEVDYLEKANSSRDSVIAIHEKKLAKSDTQLADVTAKFTAYRRMAESKLASGG